MSHDPRETRRWVTSAGPLAEDDAAIDRAVIAAMSPDERIARVWELVLRYGRLTGVDYSERRLPRSVAHVRRRER
jgi:hypothetical protein